VWEFDADDGIAEIAILVGTDKYVLWNHELGNGDWGWVMGSDLALDVSDYAGMDIRILLHSFGDPQYTLYNWNIYKIAFYTTFNNDLAITEISGPKNLDIGQTGTWDITVTNLGTLSQDFYELSFIDYKSNFPPYTIFVSEELEPGGSMEFQFLMTFPARMNTLVFADVNMPYDDFPDNNSSSKLFLRVEPELDYDVLIWDNDNDIATIWDPELGDLVGAEAGIVRALQDAGIDFILNNLLPGNLDDYEMIFCTMGTWCGS